MVHIIIQADFPVLHERHDGHGRDEFADGCGLKARLRRNRLPADGVRDAVALRPFQRAVINDGEADAGNLIIIHALRERHGRERLPLHRKDRQQRLLDLLTPRGDLLLGTVTAEKQHICAHEYR